MIVPKRHVKSPEDLKKTEILDMNKTMIKIKSALEKVLNPGGFNIGMNIGKVAGAGIANHIHVHIVPRWLGDVNYMPVVADTKVVSQSLKELYIKLKETLA